MIIYYVILRNEVNILVAAIAMKSYFWPCLGFSFVNFLLGLFDATIASTQLLLIHIIFVLNSVRDLAFNWVEYFLHSHDQFFFTRDVPTFKNDFYVR